MSAGWTVENDQQTVTAYKGSDLQLGMILAGATPTVTMTHKMGLVRLNPTTKSVANKLTYTYNQANGSYTSSTSGSATITASNDFTGNKPYTVSSQYWHIVKATGASVNTAMSFTCNTNQKDYWSAKTSGTDIGYGKYKVIDIQSDRTAANFEALFSYVGTCQTVTLPWYGAYQMQCWGGKGANSGKSIGGTGGYTVGTITLAKDKTLYVFVGGGVALQTVAGGYNGGGKGYIGPTQHGYGGGGATDIRVYVNSSKAWNDSQSLISRIMVAAGGGGSGYYLDQGYGTGGAGGGIEGQDGYETGGTWPGTGFSGLKGTQTAGGQLGNGTYPGSNGVETARHATINQYHLNDGGLGYGGWNGASVANNGSGERTDFGAPGGGSGYYGGGGANRGHGGGGGGSSFISGLTNCVAQAGYRGDNNTILKYNNIQYVFSNASTIMGGGSGYPSNPGYVNANQTNGYAKIVSQ